VGSGVSFIKCIDKHTYQRVGGSSLGGGVFLGLANLLIQENHFETLLEMSNQGKSSRVDLYMQDLYDTE
jgi:type II pantothenate kinase